MVALIASRRKVSLEKQGRVNGFWRVLRFDELDKVRRVINNPQMNAEIPPGQ